MRYWTYQELRDKVLMELDMEEDVPGQEFIKPDELVGYCNDGLAEAKAEIMKLNEDYFLSSDTMDLVQGTAEYDLPADIYAAKLRGVIYNSGSTIYPVRRISTNNKFLRVAVGNYNPPGNPRYGYFLKNTSTADGIKMVIVPTAQESLVGAITRWYIRDVQEVPLISAGSLAATLAAEVDIPEFIDFVQQYMRVRCLTKEGRQAPPTELADLEHQRKLMVDTLTEMVPDGDNEVEADMSFYEEHS